MAIDLINKALDIASQGVQFADNFLDAFENFEKLLEVATDSGINMTNYDDDLATSSVKHVDGATFNKLAIAVPNIATAIDAAGSAGAGLTIRELMNKLRQNL